MLYSLRSSRNTLRAIFDDIALQVEKLITDQIAEVTDKGIKVKVWFFSSLCAYPEHFALVDTSSWRVWSKYLFARPFEEMSCK